MASLKPRTNHNPHTDGPDVAWLELAGALVSDEDLFLQWLDEADDEQKLVLREAEDLIRAMQMRTRWEQAVLLDELGCTPKTRAAVPNMTVDQLESCRDYFDWVCDLVSLQENPFLCRQIVTGAWTFFKKCRDLERVRHAFGYSRDADGSWTTEAAEALNDIRAGRLEAAWMRANERLEALTTA